jgi:hypothetical protein
MSGLRFDEGAGPHVYYPPASTPTTPIPKDR